MLCGYSGKFSQKQCQIQLSTDNFGEQNVLESAFFKLSKSLKFKILATKVPPPGCTRLIRKPPVLGYAEIGTYVVGR